MCAPKYLNDLLGYVRSFLNWSVRRGFLDADPLRHVQPAKIRAGRGHRRALSHEELRLLFECAEIPRERRSTYMVAYYLGLRRNELRRLKRGDFDLDAARPVVRIPGIATKNAKPAVLDIPAALMPALRFLLPSEMAPFAYAFSPFGIPNMQTFRGDLTKAGICFKDFEGRRFDFHALRLTLCTHLRNAGVSKRRAMAIMRLSSERLLDHVYFDESQLSLAEELNKLPTFGVGGLSHGLSHGMDSGGLAAS
jgi:integrase